MAFQRVLLGAAQRPATTVSSALCRARHPVQQRLVSTESKSLKFPDNEFTRERTAVKHHAAQTSDTWRKLSMYLVPVGVIIASANAYNQWNEHWEHWEHMPPLEERTEYPYQNLRTKNFFWGDGDKTLFWNPNVNYHNKDKPV